MILLFCKCTVSAVLLNFNMVKGPKWFQSFRYVCCWRNVEKMVLLKRRASYGVLVCSNSKLAVFFQHQTDVWCKSLNVLHTNWCFSKLKVDICFLSSDSGQHVAQLCNNKNILKSKNMRKDMVGNQLVSREVKDFWATLATSLFAANDYFTVD